MESKTVSLTLEDAKKLYFSNNEHFKTIALGAFTKEELEKKELPTSCEDLKEIDGYYIANDSAILQDFSKDFDPPNYNKNIFATEKQARSALAYAQLTQLMKVYNEDWEPDWSDKDEVKYGIIRRGNKLSKQNYWNYIIYNSIVFKTPCLRDEFFNNFQDLLKEYFMITE